MSDLNENLNSLRDLLLEIVDSPSNDDDISFMPVEIIYSLAWLIGTSFKDYPALKSKLDPYYAQLDKNNIETAKVFIDFLNNDQDFKGIFK